ncbi:MAG: DUF4080 domain-containing protein [Spirochaetales bacterium]|nr:DUF4080 domain-containing protein [Spirochaetales bacterium]
MSKHNIGLIAINARYTHVNLALCYINRILSMENKHNVRLLEFTIHDPLLTVLSSIEQVRFNTIIFSVYIWNCEFIKKLVPEIKKVLPNTRIICGGPEVSYNATAWEDIPGIDVIVKGNAEPVIASIIDHPGNQKVIHAPAAEFSTVPFPYATDDKKFLVGRTVYYEASRGCACSCSYCVSALDDQKLSHKSVDTVKQELEFFFGLDAKIIKFVDRTFNIKKEFAREIWQFLIDKRPSVPFHFEIHPLLLEEEDFKILEQAPENLFHLEIGIQTIHSATLHKINRKGEWNKIQAGVQRLCAMKNLHTHCDILVGLPDESSRDIIASINAVFSLLPDHFQPGFLKILPGTDINSEKDRYGITHLDSPPYEVLSTRTLSFQDIQYFHKIESLINILYNSGFFIHTMRWLIPTHESPFIFLQDFLGFCLDKIDLSKKQWTSWAEILLAYCKTFLARETEYCIDLLRYDWCPFANAQHYPACIAENNKQQTLEFRAKVYEKLNQDRVSISRQVFNRSILYIPESIKMKKTLSNNLVLFKAGVPKQKLFISLSHYF